MWANYRGDLNWGHLKWCLSKVTPPPNPLDSGLGILVSFVYSYHGALMGMGPKSICYHQILPYWGKTIGFHKPLFTKAGYFWAGVTLGRLVGWLATNHQIFEPWQMRHEVWACRRGLWVCRPLALGDFCAETQTGDGKSRSFGSEVFLNIWVMAWGQRQLGNDVYIYIHIIYALTSSPNIKMRKQEILEKTTDEAS